MEDIKIEIYDKKRFSSDLNKGVKKCSDDCVDIICSYEKNNNDLKYKQDEFLNDCWNLFYDSENAYVFILYKDEKPISFNMFSNIDKNRLNMEMIWTRKDAENLGYGSKLLKYSLKNLARNNFAEVVCFVEKGNDSSIGLHNKIKNYADIKTYIVEDEYNDKYGHLRKNKEKKEQNMRFEYHISLENIKTKNNSEIVNDLETKELENNI